MKKTLCTLLFLGSIIPAAGAIAANEKFTMMDTNNDQTVSVEEFTKAYPQMQDSVFGIIDTNNDKTISLDEWLKFQADHMNAMKNNKAHEGMKGSMPHDGSNAMPPASTHPGGNMLIMPPPGE